MTLIRTKFEAEIEADDKGGVEVVEDLADALDVTWKDFYEQSIKIDRGFESFEEFFEGHDHVPETSARIFLQGLDREYLMIPNYYDREILGSIEVWSVA